MSTQDSKSELDKHLTIALAQMYIKYTVDNVNVGLIVETITPIIEAYITTRVKGAERLARLDEQKRTDGAYKRFHVKESAEGDYIGAETDWISGEKRIEQLEALTTTTNGKAE